MALVYILSHCLACPLILLLIVFGAINIRSDPDLFINEEDLEQIETVKTE